MNTSKKNKFVHSIHSILDISVDSNKIQVSQSRFNSITVLLLVWFHNIFCNFCNLITVFLLCLLSAFVNFFSFLK